MLTSMALFAVLCASGTSGDDSGGSELEFKSLRVEVGATLDRLLLPCAYDLDYSNFSLDAGSSLGASVLAAAAGEVRSEGGPFEAICKLLATAAEAENRAELGLQLATAVQSFRVLSGRERTAQWCTSDDTYYSVLRTVEEEFLYFPAERRLEIKAHSPGLRMFLPPKLVSPLPASPAPIDRLLAARWRVEELAGGGKRIHAYAPDGENAWMRLDVGNSLARLPESCTWIEPGSDSPRRFHALFRWNEEESPAVLDAVLSISIQGARVAVTRYQLRNFEQLAPDAELRLPILDPRGIRDLTGPTPVTFRTLQELPDEWLALFTPADGGEAFD